MKDSLWFSEDNWENVVIRYRCQRTVFSGRSRFAKIDIVDTYEYGRMLFLDNIAQSAELDEFIYHESLVHPAMLSHPAPEKVCVIGGAEGATIREVCRYDRVKRIVMVDIDEELVRLCQHHLQSWSNGAFADSRLELCFGDGRKYLEQTEETFDVIIVDLSDPTEDSPAVDLFTREFYQTVFLRLRSQGVACFQGESLQPNRLTLHARMVNTLASVFKWVAPYPYLLQSFHEVYSHILAAKQFDPRTLDLGGRLQSLGFNLRYLTPTFLQGLFRMPGYVEEAYKRYPELITDARPCLYSL